MNASTLLVLLGVVLAPVGRPALAARSGQGGGPCPDTLRILVEKPFADRSGLHVGDTVPVLASPGSRPCPAEIGGVFRPRPDPAALTRQRPRVLFHLPQLAGLTGRPDEVDRFSVRLAAGTDPDSAARSLAPFLPEARVVSTAEVARRSSTTFAVVQRFHRAIGVITLVAGAVFLACIMVLKVQERRGAVAALRLIGVSKRTLFTWILAEAALVSVVGGIIGIGLGEAASAIINHHYRSVYRTALVFSRVTPGTIDRALVLAVGLGLAAGAAAALHLLSLDPLREAQR